MKALIVLLLAVSPLTAFAGRFELVQLGIARADQYLLDTQTGKMWRSACAHKTELSQSCNYSIWEPVDVVGISVTPEQVGKNIDRWEKLAQQTPPTPN